MQWLEEQLGDFDDDYILFDCPGMIVCMELKQDSYSCYLECVLNKCFFPSIVALSEFCVTSSFQSSVLPLACVTSSFQMAIISHITAAKHHLAAKNVQTLA